MNKRVVKIALVFLLLGIAYALYATGVAGQLTLDNLKLRHAEFAGYYADHPTVTIAAFFAAYVLATALSVPGATILTLAGGALFGFWVGFVVVSFASTLGATAAFLLARFVLRDPVQRRFGSRLAVLNEGFAKNGAFYLFTLRLVPVFPFVLVNLLTGLTPIRVLTYMWVSQVGMLAGTAAYVNAGTQLSKLTSLKSILSPGLLASFAVLGLLPLVSKAIVEFISRRRVYRRFVRPRSFDYNVVVIGGGSAGLISAYIASAVKAKVALVEKHKMGGDCLNTGCVPSKAFIRSAKVLSYLRRSQEFGLGSASVTPQFAEVMERVQRVIKKIEPHDSVERYTGLGVECLVGNATIRSPFEVAVDGKVLTTKNIIVATGARPLMPAIAGIEAVQPLTSETVWGLRTLPKRLLVLGGGPIGCELAQAFARFGAQVTVVEVGPRLLAREDEDVSAFVLKKLQSEGITVLTGHKATAFLNDAGSKTLVCDASGRERRVDFDEVLLALGRKPNVEGFGLEALGVEIAEGGTIAHDEFLRTNYANLYVCGDVAGPYQFTHTAAHQAWYAAVNALFSPFKRFKADYRVIPWCTFMDPEVARVGLNEADARAQKIPYVVTTYGIDDLDRAIAEEEDHGFVKVLTPPGKDTVLGVTIVGAHAGDIIAEYVAAMKHGFGLNKILGTIHIYPTLTESNKAVAGQWKKATAPQKALAFLGRFHAWRRG